MTKQHVARVICAVIAAFCVASTRAQNENPSDAFYTAIRANDLTRLAAMLNERADPNVKDARGVTPLMQAAIVGSPDAMKLLLDNGADPNAANNSGSTALMFSVTDMRKVRLLLDRGANANAASKFGRSALLLSAMSDRSADIVRLLIAKGADVKASDGFKTTVLHAAAQGNDTETIRQLLDAGLDPNAVNLAGFTPLMTIASNGNLSAVKLLLVKGANVNAVSNDGSFQKVKAGAIALGNWTPLLLAAPFGSIELVKALLDAGAKVNVQDVRGMTPLMTAVASDHQSIEVIRLLVARGADVNAKSPAGATALDWARRSGSTSAIDVLKRAGAAETPGKAAALPAFAPADLKTSVQKSVTLLEQTSIGAAANGGCASCHHHNVTDFATSIARQKGIRIDEKAAGDRQQLTKAPFFSPLNLLERMDAAGSPDVPLYALTALGSAGYEPDRTTDAIVANLLAHQRADGRWTLGGVARPPIEDGDIFRTALAIGVMKIYAPPGLAADVTDRMRRATNWLSAARAVTSEDRNMQLIGLESAGVEKSHLRRLGAAILATQRPDGGWAQRAELTSDAYATGQTLFALAKTGIVSTQDAAYQKGVKYLLSTQHGDGSWYVRSRAPKFQPYFESGFPYGHDQWISAMGTGWATAALAMTLPDSRVAAR
jgi:ankyrin repeat protein